MKTLYFKNRLVGGADARYFECEKPYKKERLVIEVTHIPDEVDSNTVRLKLNETNLWKVETVNYSELGTGKLITNNHGGQREGAGRPSTGRKKQQIYATDEEMKEVKKLIEEMRSTT